jgi:hypothetical protein
MPVLSMCLCVNVCASESGRWVQVDSPDATEIAVALIRAHREALSNLQYMIHDSTHLFTPSGYEVFEPI